MFWVAVSLGTSITEACISWAAGRDTAGWLSLARSAEVLVCCNRIGIAPVSCWDGWNLVTDSILRLCCGCFNMQRFPQLWSTGRHAMLVTCRASSCSSVCRCLIAGSPEEAQALRHTPAFFKCCSYVATRPLLASCSQVPFVSISFSCGVLASMPRGSGLLCQNRVGCSAGQTQNTRR